MKKITVLSELKREFSGIVEASSNKLSSFIKSSPRTIFASMIVMIGCSLLLCFTVLRIEPKVINPEKKALVKVESGFLEIGKTVTTLKKTLEMREAMKVLLSKDSLTSQDSVVMIGMIDELEQIRLKNKKNNHEKDRY